MVEQAAQARIDRARSTLRTALVEMAKARTGLSGARRLTMIAADKAEPEAQMANEDEDAAKDYRDGFNTGIEIASMAVLETVLLRILTSAADPYALRLQLRADALRRAGNASFGTGTTTRFIEGARDEAIGRIEGFFGPVRSARTQ